MMPIEQRASRLVSFAVLMPCHGQVNTLKYVKKVTGGLPCLMRSGQMQLAANKTSSSQTLHQALAIGAKK
jgi:hypothetical protein